MRSCLNENTFSRGCDRKPLVVDTNINQYEIIIWSATLCGDFLLGLNWLRQKLFYFDLIIFILKRNGQELVKSLSLLYLNPFSPVAHQIFAFIDQNSESPKRIEKFIALPNALAKVDCTKFLQIRQDVQKDLPLCKNLLCKGYCPRPFYERLKI